MNLLSSSDPEFSSFIQTLNRQALPDPSLQERVSSIIQLVQDEGNEALKQLTAQYDSYSFPCDESLFVSDDEFSKASCAVSPESKQAIQTALTNIHEFTQQSKRQDWSYHNAQGALVGERFVPFDRVGVYVPGGKAPLVSSALMTAGFAQAIGVPSIIAATPVNAQGEINSALLYALQEAGVTEVLKVGGAQAIAALALGTQSIQPVEKIVGPGNAYVVEAKRQLTGAVSIDLLPGPSEILVISDSTGRADYIAADLLAQAEHGPDSQIGFITTSKDLFSDVQSELTKQSATLQRGAYIQEVLEKATFALQVESLEHAIEICNVYAPEHLLLIAQESTQLLDQVKTAGAIYLGNHSAVAVGDFLAGPSHTLPTGGAGKSFSGLRADQFQRRTSIVELDSNAVAKSLSTVEEFARLEGLDAHGHSVRIRVNNP